MDVSHERMSEKRVAVVHLFPALHDHLKGISVNPLRCGI
jgi:hypothetical protein